MTQNREMPDNEGQLLLDEFSSPTCDEWRAAVDKLLKGAPYEKIMPTDTYEGIQIQPMYRREDVEGLPHLDSLPGLPPYVRSIHALGYIGHPWEVAQETSLPFPEECNTALRHDLERGQTTANIQLDDATLEGLDPDQAKKGQVGNGGTSIAGLKDLEALFKDIDLGKTPVFMDAYSSGPVLTAILAALCRKRGSALEKLSGNIGMDPIGELAKAGRLPLSLQQAFNHTADLIRWADRNAPDLGIITVHGHPYHNAGGSAVQELAFSISTAVETVRALLQRGLHIDTVAPKIRFSFSLGSQFFMETAKLRAARMMWSSVVAACGGDSESQKMEIHGRTSSWNKTMYDPYVNMLRTTTEAFSALVGGCDSLHVGAFDEPVRLPDEFARRIARNTQIILKEECHCNQVADPAGGSWFVESLTDAVAQKSWQLFQQIEKAGGMINALKAEIPQKMIAATAAQRRKNIYCRKDVILGTNMYANVEEEPLKEHRPDFDGIFERRAEEIISLRQEKSFRIDPENPVESMIDACLDGATLGQICETLKGDHREDLDIKPLPVFRGAETFESLRKTIETHVAKTGQQLKVFLANMGPASQHKTRADFSRRFFQVAGFTVLTTSGFQTPEAAAEAAIESDAAVVVICSTDPTYPELAPPLTQQIKKNKPGTVVVLAGYPRDQVEALQAAGVDEFIHVRSDTYDVLSRLASRFGVEGIDD